VNINNSVDNSTVVINLGTVEGIQAQEAETRTYSFSDTNLEAVVRQIMENPAQFQIALEVGQLHQELCKVTHYGNIEENHTIMDIQPKGTTMRVLDKGYITTLEQSEGLGRIVRNNMKLTEHPEVGKYIKGLKNSKQANKVLKNLIMSNGHYVSNDIQKQIPYEKVSSWTFAELRQEFESIITIVEGHDEYNLLQGVCRKVCSGLLLHASRWWLPLDKGYAIYREDPYTVFKDQLSVFLQKVRAENNASMNINPNRDAEGVLYAMDQLLKRKGEGVYAREVVHWYRTRNQSLFKLGSLKL
jgi:hypothetical protein